MRNFNLTKEEKFFLLSLARNTISLKIDNKDSPQSRNFSKTLERLAGVFVTLNKNDQLCGCIGYVEGIKPLQTAVEEMAIAAAFNDPRFPPLEKEDMKDLDIEISILSPLEILADINNIEIGKHGLIIESGLHRGLLLPQVAVEYNWNNISFLEHTCQKAGLSVDAWKDESTKIQVFSAEIFSESGLAEN
jgi:AmmeMemoRadiSam system protein A